MTGAAQVNVLFVCTANICRSPMAAALFARHVEDLGLEANVASAGLLESGRPSPPEIVEALARRGVELAAPHVSEQLDADMVRHSDLVLGMERHHAREAIVMAPEARARTFTLKQLLRLAEHQPLPVRTSLASWLTQLDSSRTDRDLVGQSPADDVDDPFGGPRRSYERTADELDVLTGALAHLLEPALALPDHLDS